jgi:hypothetical protein
MKQKKIFIRVSEPWDFESLDGKNTIRGNILSQKSNQCIVFHSNHCLRFGEVQNHILILTPRHYGHDFNKLKDEIVVFNGSILLKEYSEQLNENDLRNNSKFVIIGSFE